ncbi:MAG: hypothetical protein U0531_20615 [Dehalococcoidia bacterium]
MPIARTFRRRSRAASRTSEALLGRAEPLPLVALAVPARPRRRRRSTARWWARCGSIIAAGPCGRLDAEQQVAVVTAPGS